MFKKLSSAFIALFLFLFLSQSSVLAFIDTDDKKVEALYDQGIIENSARFYPTRYISRGDYVMWLLKNREIFLQQDEKTLEPFSDIDKQNYAPYVAKAWRMGILETAREFYPNRSLTRLEALEILFRSEGIATPLFVEIDGFRDLPRSSKDRGVIAKALEMNLLDSISENEFGVNSKLTKLEAAQLLYNMQKITRADELIFSDKKDTTVIVNTGKKKQKEEVFDQVWDMVHNRYIKADDLDDEELMYAAIKGMVESLGDEHSVFLPKIESQSFLAPLDNSTEGIGAFVDFNAQEEVIFITQPIKNSPAEKAGLKAGDLILEANGVSLKGLHTKEAIQYTRGKAGTAVKLLIKRGGKTFEVDVAREKIDFSPVHAEKKGDILIVSINSFGSKMVSDFENAIEDYYDSDTRGIIIDLRGNPGGFLSAALDLLAFFFEERQVGVIQQEATIRYKRYIKSNGILKDVPTIVLMDENSASASEIFAGAIQDYKRGVVMGTVSYGKGTVQELTRFPDGSSFKITVAEWHTPLDRSINKVGVTPDVDLEGVEGEALINSAIRQFNTMKWEKR